MSYHNAKLKMKVSNMSCRACEERIKKALLKDINVLKVNVNYIENSIEIFYNDFVEIDIVTIDNVKRILNDINYPIVEENKDKKYNYDNSKATINNNKIKEWGYSIIILSIILVVCLSLYRLGIFSRLEIFSRLPEAKLPYLFVIGLFTSLHCVSMCGGINISQSVNARLITQNNRQKVVPAILYNLGRVISYTIIGGILGGIGAVITLTIRVQGFIMILASFFMLIMGLNMLGLFSPLRKLMPHLPVIFTNKIEEKKVGKGPFIIGILNGLMPCGPLQMMQMYALTTGSFLLGALSMFLFSFGTVPLMVGLGVTSSILSTKFTNVMMKVSAILVVILGIMMFNNGFVFVRDLFGI